MWVAQAEAQVDVELLLPNDVQYLWLPLSHSFGSVLLLGQLQIGFVTVVDGRIDRIIENLAVVRPTFMAAAPRVYEKVMQGVVAGAEKLPRFVRSLFKRALARSIARQRRRFVAGKPYRGPAGPDALILAKVKRRFGGRIRMFVSGGARLDPEVAVFFAAIGVPILEGYGLTETAGATAINQLGTLLPGTVGPVMPGTEVRILRAMPDDLGGEVLLRGRGVMRGYWGRSDATAAALDADGWLHTGDKGLVDEAGRLRITGRIKDQFKTSNGKYVDPEKIAAMLTADCPLIGQAIVVGESRSYCVALFALEPDVAQSWARRQDIVADTATISAMTVTRDEVQRAVDRYNARSSVERWETIKKFAILPESPTVENGLMTPSMKIRRGAVIERYAELINDMYA